MIFASIPLAAKSGSSLAALSSPNEPPPRLMTTLTFNRSASCRLDAGAAGFVPNQLSSSSPLQSPIRRPTLWPAMFIVAPPPATAIWVRTSKLSDE
jgi:hypothetical protein